MEKIEINNSLKLNTLSGNGTRKNRKRVGRGIGSGTGKTAAFALPIIQHLENEMQFAYKV